MSEAKLTAQAAPGVGIETTLGRYRAPLLVALQAAMAQARAASEPQLGEMYDQIEYHLGWRGADLAAAPRQPR